MRNRTIILLILFFIPIFCFGQNLFPGADQQAFFKQSAMLGQMKYGDFEESEEDSFDFSYEKSPGRAFLFSLILPGAGEFYAGKKWRALAFFGLEAASWGMYFQQKNKGEDIEQEYKEFADTHWSFDRWLDLSPMYEACGPEGSHALMGNLELDGEPVAGTEFELDKHYEDVTDSLEAVYPEQSYQFAPVMSRDFYENIGKYDQFACGWDDFETVNTAYDTVIMNDRRDKYLTRREDSNKALKFATNAVTAIMFNHLFSALHAQIAAKNYHSEEADKVSWNLNLIPDYRKRKFVRGFELSIAF